MTTIAMEDGVTPTSIVDSENCQMVENNLISGKKPLGDTRPTAESHFWPAGRDRLEWNGEIFTSARRTSIWRIDNL